MLMEQTLHAAYEDLSSLVLMDTIGKGGFATVYRGLFNRCGTASAVVERHATAAPEQALLTALSLSSSSTYLFCPVTRNYHSRVRAVPLNLDLRQPAVSLRFGSPALAMLAANVETQTARSFIPGSVSCWLTAKSEQQRI